MLRTINQNKQLIELEKFNASEIIKTDSLKGNISIEEISNNPEMYKILPGELDAYSLRSKQSSNIVESKTINSGLKVFHFISKQLKEKITELNLHYVHEYISKQKTDYFTTFYAPEQYKDSYNDILLLCKNLNSFDQIELLGLETEVIKQTFNE